MTNIDARRRRSKPWLAVLVVLVSMAALGRLMLLLMGRLFVH